MYLVSRNNLKLPLFIQKIENEINKIATNLIILF